MIVSALVVIVCGVFVGYFGNKQNDFLADAEKNGCFKEDDDDCNFSYSSACKTSCANVDTNAGILTGLSIGGVLMCGVATIVLALLSLEYCLRCHNKTTLTANQYPESILPPDRFTELLQAVASRDETFALRHFDGSSPIGEIIQGANDLLQSLEHQISTKTIATNGVANVNVDNGSGSSGAVIVPMETSEPAVDTSRVALLRA